MIARATRPPARTVRISEIFTSIQGEGASAGTPSVFVRLQGCSVGCAWCDTKYSWDPGRGRALPLEDVVRRAVTAGPSNVVVTGGEPLENVAFQPLVDALKDRRLRVEVETAGTQVPPDVAVDQWNVSIKLASSGVDVTRRLRPDAIARFRDVDAWFKFVVAGDDDVDEVRELERRFALPASRILLMPLGLRRDEQLERMPAVAEACRRHGYRFSPRLHILIWGPKRGV